MEELNYGTSGSTNYHNQSEPAINEHPNSISNISSFTSIDKNNSINNVACANPSQKDLFRILNQPQHGASQLNHHPASVPMMGEEDVAFLQAAKEIVRMNENKVDPTIRDILNRLQYSNSPHGGMPISMQYLRSIEGVNDESENESEKEFDQCEDGDHHHSDNNFILGHRFNNGGANLNEGNGLLSPGRSDIYTKQYHIHSPQDSYHQNVGNPLIVPPFTENPLRNPPNNLEFPQFSLDIFKTNQNLQGQGYINHFVSNNRNTKGYEDEDAGNNSEEKEDYYGEEVDDLNFEGRQSRKNSSSKNDRSTSQVNENEPRNYKCQDCGISFKRSSDLKRHEKIHLKTPPNICPQCRKGFARRDALKRHIGTLTCNRNRKRLIEKLQEEGNFELVQQLQNPN